MEWPIFINGMAGLIAVLVAVYYIPRLSSRERWLAWLSLGPVVYHVILWILGGVGIMGPMERSIYGRWVGWLLLWFNTFWIMSYRRE